MAARCALPRRIPARLVDAERRLRRDSHDAQAVVADGSDDPRDFSAMAIAVHRRDGVADHVVNAAARSEEHTSELKSLMRIAYDVFCLKKTQPVYCEWHIPNTNAET